MSSPGMSSRLKTIRLSTGLSQGKFAEKIELKSYNIRDMESDKQNITIDVAEKIEEKFNISGWWLLTGKGEKYINNKNITKEKKNTNDDITKIKFYDHVNSLASDSNELLHFDRELLFKLSNQVNDKEIAIVLNQGNSMEPTINNYTYMMIDLSDNSQETFIDGSIYLIKYIESYLVRRVVRNISKNTIKLKCDNKDFESEKITNDQLKNVIFIGRIVGTINKI